MRRGEKVIIVFIEKYGDILWQGKEENGKQKFKIIFKGAIEEEQQETRRIEVDVLVFFTVVRILFPSLIEK